jgi:hypothetical protein
VISRAAAEAAQPALGTGDFLSIAALCAVVVAALLVPISALLRGTRQRLKRVEMQLDGENEEVRYREVTAAIAGRGFAGASNSLEALAGMLQRVVEGRAGEVEVAKAMRQLHELRSDVERAWMELRLLTGDRTERTSALQQLERLGDQWTARNLEIQLQDGVAGVEKERYEETLHVIRERVDPERENE